MNIRFKVFAAYNIFQNLCDYIHVLIFVTVSKSRKSPKLTDIVILTKMDQVVIEDYYHMTSMNENMNQMKLTHVLQSKISLNLSPLFCISPFASKIIIAF